MADWSLSSCERQEFNFGAIPRTAPANVKGAYTQITANTSFSYDAITLQMYQTGGGGSCFLVDIAIGPAGSEQVILSNILLDSMRSAQVGAVLLDLPISIPAGSRIAARVQDPIGSGTRNLQLAVIGSSGGANFSQASAPDAVTYGANTANSNGTLIDQGATANVFGAWTEMTAATSRNHSGVAAVLGINQQTTSGLSEFNIQIGVGESGAEVPIAEMRTCLPNGSSLRLVMNVARIAAQIPVGTRLSMRSKGTLVTASDRIVTAILLGY